MTIRLEHKDDYQEILKLTYESFLTLDYEGRKGVDEHYLIHLLKDSKFVIRELCFVAEIDGEIVGHILYTKSEVICPSNDNKAKDTITFGPLSVRTDYHRQGVGTALVKHSIEKAREMGFGAILITGVPDYYPKLGFSRSCDYDLTLSDGTSPDAFMAYELQNGYLNGGGTLRFLPSEFEQAENDIRGFEEFHTQFMSKQYPSMLTLRPFFDGDIARMERWLYMPHIAKWFEHPDNWLNELSKRHSEFSFITHFIAEYEGVAIGFCQYYDTFYSQHLEDWDEQWNVGEGKGRVFSMDYLIGNEDYLRRGFGKEMISQILAMLRKIGAKTVIVDPEKENFASCQAFLANGFVSNGTDYYLHL